MKTICYLRYYNKSQLYSLAKLIRPKYQVKIISEYNPIDETGLNKIYYQNLNLYKKKFFAKKTENEIILRCRLLRNIKKSEAIKHLNAMAFAINKVFKKEKPNLIFMQTVDNYISHILYLISKKRKIKFIGIVASPINNYFRVTSLGEKSFNKKFNLNNNRKIFKDYLKKNYIPFFNQKSVTSPKKYIFLRWIRNTIKIIYFYILRVISLDFFNYHFWATYLVSRMNFNLFLPKDPGDYNWKKKISKKKNNLYIPLQMYPEATIDYACENLKFLDYYKVLNKFINTHYKNFNIFIKEHPNIMGFRPSGFYESLSKDKRITVIPTYEHSNSVLENVNCTLVWTGTVGFDSLLKGVPVISFCNPYYASGKRFLKISENTRKNAINNHINKFKTKKISPAEKKEIFFYLAKQLFKGNYKFHGDWNIKNNNDLRDIRIMSKSLKVLF